MRLKDIIKVLRNLDKAIIALENNGKYKEELNYLIDAARDKGLIENGNFGTGTAIELAKKYKLEFAIGTCFSDCRAVLNKTDWQYLLDKHVSPFDYGAFQYTPPDEIEHISGFGHTITLAILRCLINAKTARVI